MPKQDSVPVKSKSKKWVVWVSIVCGVLLLGGVGYWFFAIKGKDQTIEQESVGIPTENGGGDEEDTANGEEPEEPKEVLKGFWVPYMNGAGGPGSSFDPVIAWAKGHGANTLVFPIDFSPHVGGAYLNQLPEGRRESINGTIQKAHEEGMEVMVVVSAVGEGPPSLDEVDLEQLNEYIIEVATIAEANDVEYFQPFCEPSGMFWDFLVYLPPYNEGKEDERLIGEPVVNAWAQEILTEIRAVYTGEIVWRDDTSPFEYCATYDVCSIDFSGYDYIAFGPTPDEDTVWGDLEGYSNYIDGLLDAAFMMAERDGVKGVMYGEFGVWGWDLDKHTDEEIIEAHEIVLEKGREEGVVGFFVLVDPDEGELEGFDESPIKDLIDEWFKDILL